jgi:hypothetical protein
MDGNRERGDPWGTAERPTAGRKITLRGQRRQLIDAEKQPEFANFLLSTCVRAAIIPLIVG